ncbi:hypothetical protein PGTUg99_011771 [Puccinia graminis f. sp. tritici]|uniref:Uncharacterized protein n=1 Tax=Puccinia graminis f. sp. tritici TaxID=56615 RepID=A0A5B0LS04_PUCGR|nr:hypothetical protein PGTUg99_011771 [Puccinia graminis f. sp. tritici]
MIFMLLIVIACATGLFACPRSQYGYCAFEDLLTIPINYAFGPAFALSSTTPNSLSLTCQYSHLPVGTPKGTCCDKSVGDAFLRSPGDPLIIYYDDYIKAGCHEVPSA